MSEFLFNVKETLSPRLAWMRKHGIKLHATPPELVGQEDELEGEIAAFYAYVGEQDDFANVVANKIASGATDNEALLNLAAKLKIKHWNEI